RRAPRLVHARVGLREHDDLDPPELILELEERHRPASAAGLDFSQLAHDTGEHDLLPVHLLAELSDVRRGVALDVLLEAVERVPREVEPEGLALADQALLGRPLLGAGVLLHVDGLGRGEHVEQPALPALAVALRPLPLLDRTIEGGVDRRTGMATRHAVERTRAVEPFERPLVDLTDVDAATQIE